MDDQRIFGPLTMRQFLYAVAGIALSYFVYGKYAAGTSIPAIILIAVICFILIRQSAPSPFNERYIQRKKAELGAEKFHKWTQKIEAMMQAQIALRKERGLPPDPGLENALQMFKKGIGTGVAGQPVALVDEHKKL